jgi:hypothetical protein
MVDATPTPAEGPLHELPIDPEQQEKETARDIETAMLEAMASRIGAFVGSEMDCVIILGRDGARAWCASARNPVCGELLTRTVRNVLGAMEAKYPPSGKVADDVISRQTSLDGDSARKFIEEQ